MIVKTGIDLVFLPRFRQALKRGGEKFLRRVFLANELEEKRVEHLAGIFAAKEAVMKALGLPVDSWHDIQITKDSSGLPEAKITNYQLPIINYSLSISHDGNYVIAHFIALVKR